MSSSPEPAKLLKKKKVKFTICSIKSLRKLSQSDVFSYINDLHDALKRKTKKLKKYKEKVNHLTKKISRLNIKSLNDDDNRRLENDPEVNNEGIEEDKVVKTFVEEIREAAELAQNEQGFVFEPTSGLYYDHKTGYYYNAEYGLYYDGNSGCYYKYNQDDNEFIFHSQVAKPEENLDQVFKKDYLIDSIVNKFDDLNIDRLRTNAIGKDDDSLTKNLKRKNGRKASKKKSRHAKSSSDSNSHDDYEEGEIVTSSSDDNNSLDVDQNDFENGIYEDVAQKYPPSLRIIVQETNVEKVKVGTLYLITYKGGSLGREGDHDVIIPDLNISKYHLKFLYNESKSLYQCVDLGSRNGTLLNAKRMSASKQESDPLDLVHGSILQISQTKLLCHIHPGNSTCDYCEPGLLMIEQSEPKKITILTHREQLKKIQKKYGLENEKFVIKKEDRNYTDRAATRRVDVGSSTDKEKTQIASVDTAISSENKGFKMLSKLGWNKGETLGKENSGIHEPIPITSNDGTKGLGCAATTLPANRTTKISFKKMITLNKTKERFKNLPASDSIFNDSDTSNE